MIIKIRKLMNNHLS